MKLKRLPYVAQVLILFVAYFLTGKLGLALAPVSGFATLAWPPTGISLAALLLLGYRLWPGIALGALAVNLTTGAPLTTALGIAIGNSAEALSGAFLLRRYFGFHSSLDRTKDAIALVIVGILLSSPISATIGTLSLWLGNVVNRSTIAATWLAWWVGDGLSDVLVAPFILVWATLLKSTKLRRRRVGEAASLFVLLAVTSGVIFSGRYEAMPGNYPLAYLTFPFLIWAALRFGQRGAVTASMVITTFAIWGTFRNIGVYHRETTVAHLYAVQTYLAATSITAVILASVIAARNAAEGALSRAHDELERKVVERTGALHASEEEMQKHLSVLTAITESTTDPIFIKGLDGRYQMINSVTARLFGKSVDEVLGCDDTQLFPPEIAKRLRAKDRAIIDSGQADTFEEDAVFQGQTRCFLVNKTPYRDTHGKIVGVIGITRDITERKHISDELQVEKEKFRGLVESAPDATVIVNEQGRIELFNKMAEVRFGYSSAEAMGQPVEILIPERFRKLYGNRRAEYVAHPTAGPMGVGLDLYGRRKDGSEFPVDISLSPLKTERGILISSSIRDISKRRASEEERAELLKLERRARARAEEAIRMRDELVAMVSHDLKNPLAAILTGTHLIQNANWVEEQGKRPLAMIKRSAEQMSRLIQDLLDSHKIEARCFDVQSGLGVHDVLHIVQKAVEVQQILAGDKKLHLEIDVPENLPMIIVNAERIQQVFQNLIDNAIKFTPCGGVIRLKAERIGANVLFSIKDSGPGIEDSLLPHIFERFSQARKTAKAGTGLGLSIAKGIVEAHGGTIWAECRRGEGCTFFFTLPVAQVKSQEKAA